MLKKDDFSLYEFGQYHQARISFLVAIKYKEKFGMWNMKINLAGTHVWVTYQETRLQHCLY